jgi:hypothetical protein
MRRKAGYQMSANERIGAIGKFRETFSILRDVLLTAVFVFCLFNPGSIRTFLKESGLSKLGVFGVTVEVQEEREKIHEAQQRVTGRVVDASAAAIDETPVEALNRPVDQEFKQAVLAAEMLAPQVLPTAGWVFLGRVDSAKSRWEDGGSKTTTASWPIVPNETVTVKDDVYVRAIAQGKWHSSAPVATVAKVGDQLKVVEIEYSPAKIGGFFVWAKVAIQSS